jgi:hypothetical protein
MSWSRPLEQNISIYMNSPMGVSCARRVNLSSLSGFFVWLGFPVWEIDMELVKAQRQLGGVGRRQGELLWNYGNMDFGSKCHWSSLMSAWRKEAWAKVLGKRKWKMPLQLNASMCSDLRSQLWVVCLICSTCYFYWPKLLINGLQWYPYSSNLVGILCIFLIS